MKRNTYEPRIYLVYARSDDWAVQLFAVNHPRANRHSGNRNRSYTIPNLITTSLSHTNQYRAAHGNRNSGAD